MEDLNLRRLFLISDVQEDSVCQEMTFSSFSPSQKKGEKSSELKLFAWEIQRVDCRASLAGGPGEGGLGLGTALKNGSTTL